MIALHKAVADKIEADPSLLRVPLQNIDNWLAQDHSSPHRLRQWREIIVRAQQSKDGFSTLLRLLRSEDEKAIHLKSFDPFPGVLTSQERQKIIKECAYAH
jgi:hypothetical protein